jgi:hypothetical protein
MLTGTCHLDCDRHADELAQRFALLKRHVYAQPFEHVFEQIDQGKAVTEILDIPYRGEERTFISSQGKDRVTVVYAINFKDKDDIILGKVFLGVRSIPKTFQKISIT